VCALERRQDAEPDGAVVRRRRSCASQSPGAPLATGVTVLPSASASSAVPVRARIYVCGGRKGADLGTDADAGCLV
jgi:hypothetical protein